MIENFTSIVCEATRGQSFNLTEFNFITMAQIVIGIVVVFSILSNFLVIKVFLKSEAISPVHLLYVNISFSDELVLLSCLSQLSDSCVTCVKVNSYVSTVSAYVSSYTMLLVSIKRYYAISRPFHEMYISANNAQGPRSFRKKLISKQFLWTYLQIALIWTGAISTVLPLYNYGQVVPCESGNLYSKFCASILDTMAATMNFPWTVVLTTVAIPAIGTSVCTILAVIILYRRKTIGDSSFEMQKQLTRQKIRSIALVVSIVLAFVICWLPLSLFYAINSHTGNFTCNQNYIQFSVSAIFLVLHYAINPIIYWLLNSEFQRGLQSIFKQLDCRQSCKSHDQSQDGLYMV